MVEFTDFGRQQIYDDDGKLIPSQDFYFLKFDNGYSYACRASGTEPKIKFYVFANEKAEAKGDLDSVKKTTEGKINSFCKAIDADARLRAEG